MLCNDAELFQQEGAWKVEGDPTEGALYPFATKLGMDRQAEQAASPRIDAIPFESEHRFMATLHRPASGAEVLFVKGAPEVILEHCDRQQTRDGRAGADRSRALPGGVGQARGAGRARAGAGLARESRRSRPAASVRPTCRRTSSCSG